MIRLVLILRANVLQGAVCKTLLSTLKIWRFRMERTKSPV